MPRLVSLDGQTYSIPERGDVGWGSLTDLLEKLTNDVNALNQSQLATPIPFRRRVRVVTTSPETFLSTDDVLLIQTNSLSSFNLPDTSTLQTGKVITVKDDLGVADTLTIQIVGFGSQTIDGASSYTLDENWSDQSFIKKEDGNWAKIDVIPDEFEFGLLPVGSLIPLTTHLTGSITPPASGVIEKGLMLCDGSVIPGGAKLSGTLPNLTDGRFLMGSTSSGTVGAATDLTHNHTFAHTHGTNSQLSTVDFSHSHTGATGGQKADFSADFLSSAGAASFNKTELNTNQNVHYHNYRIEYCYDFAALGLLSGGGSAMIQLYNYETGTPVTGTTSTIAGRDWNTGLSLGTTNRTLTYKNVEGRASGEIATWSSATVNTTFTNPTVNAANLNTNQNNHTHTLSSDLSIEDFSHSHSTTSQDVTDTGNALSAVSVRPQYFSVLYLMRVL